MLESPLCLISRDSPNSCDEESQWAFNTKCLMELSGKKRPREDDDKDYGRPCKFRKLNPIGDEEYELDPILADQLGRDGSISCLMRCSRADYGVMALLNKSFRSLIQSGELYKLRRHVGVISELMGNIRVFLGYLGLPF